MAGSGRDGGLWEFGGPDPEIRGTSIEVKKECLRLLAFYRRADGDRAQVLGVVLLVFSGNLASLSSRWILLEEGLLGLALATKFVEEFTSRGSGSSLLRVWTLLSGLEPPFLKEINLTCSSLARDI